MPRDRCPYKSVWLFLEKICELFVGTNKTVGHSIRVFVERGSTVLFYVPFHLSTEQLFLSVCRIEGMQERWVYCYFPVLHDFCNRCGIDYFMLSSAE